MDTPQKVIFADSDTPVDNPLLKISPTQRDKLRTAIAEAKLRFQREDDDKVMEQLASDLGGTDPPLRHFDVWSDGYRVMCDEAGTAYCLGSDKAESFAKAVEAVLAQPDNQHLRSSFNSEHLTIWGCRLFDNEKEARASFG